MICKWQRYNCTVLPQELLITKHQIFSDLDISSYADDNTPHSTNKNVIKVLHDPEKMSNTLFKWFTDNLLEANPQKSHLLTNSTQELQINIGGIAISNSKREKLLGIHTDNKLTIEPHLRFLYEKASQKLMLLLKLQILQNLKFFLMLS